MTGLDTHAVITISSHVIRGCVGNRAVAFALETLGHSVWAVPTVTMPWHPGQGRSTRMVPVDEDFDAALSELSDAIWHPEVRAILTGYFANVRQVKSAVRLIEKYRERDPGLIYLCDPVIGDESGLYVPVDVAGAIRDELLPLATIATPNRFELSWLADSPVDDNAAIEIAAKSLNAREVIVTSAYGFMTASIGNLLLCDGKAVLAEHRVVEGAPNGLGDLFAALYLSRRVNGLSNEEALQRAAASVWEIAMRSTAAGADELLLAREAASLRAATAGVSLRTLVSAGSRRAISIAVMPDSH